MQETLRPVLLNSLSSGEVAVKLSHDSALRRCLEPLDNETSVEPPGSCLILEDDFAATGPQLAERWRASAAALPEKWDVLYLGRCYDWNCNQSATAAQQQAARLSLTPNASSQASQQDQLEVLPEAPPGNEWLGGDLYRAARWKGELRHTPKCLHSYAVTPEGARAMLDGHRDCTGAECVADGVPGLVAKRGQLLSISPALFTQSAALRLAHDSGTVATPEDIQRGVASDRNSVRPIFVAECDAQASSAPVSTVAPTLRSQNTHSIKGDGRALSKAYGGLHNRELNGSTPFVAPTGPIGAPISACDGNGLRNTNNKNNKHNNSSNRSKRKGNRNSNGNNRNNNSSATDGNFLLRPCR